MKYVIIGGDERMLCLRRMLKKEGDVQSFALCDADCGDIPHGDVYILPIPIRRGEYLNAPLVSPRYPTAEILSRIPYNALVIGGGDCGEDRLRCFDLMRRPDFVAGNAQITAEAALSLLMTASPRRIFGQKVLVIGGGRIGSLLADMLSDMGAVPTLLTGSPEKAAMAGCRGIAATDSCTSLESFDAVINTAPAIVLSDAAQMSARPDCTVIELASKSGFSTELSYRCRFINAPGLPAKYAPESAAELILNAVNNIVKERYHG